MNFLDTKKNDQEEEGNPNGSIYSHMISHPAPSVNNNREEGKYNPNETEVNGRVGGRLRPTQIDKKKVLDAAKLNKLSLCDFKCLETTYLRSQLKITNSFHKETLEKVMFKISFNDNISFEDECYMMFKIGDLPKSKHHFTQMRSYQEIEMSSGRKSRWVLSVEAGVCSMRDALIYREQSPYTEQNIVCIGYQLLTALNILHQNMIFHSDIKPENIFLFKSEDNEWIYKIGDFGTSIICTEAVIRLEDVRGHTPGYSHPNVFEYFENTIKNKETVNFIEADLFSMAKTFKDLIRNTSLTECQELEGIIEDMMMTKIPLENILKRMQKLYEQHAKKPDESIVEKMSRINLLKNYKELLQFENNIDTLFDSRSLFDAMEYCRILEYFLLLRDFESLKLWKKATIRLFGELIQRIFINDEQRGNKVLGINLNILEASFCDEEAYMIGKTNPKEVEKFAKKKEEILKKICEESESIFGTESLASSFTKMNLFSFYEEMQKHYQLDAVQKNKLQSLFQFEVADSGPYKTKRLNILDVCRNFFGFELTEPWVVEFAIKIFQSDPNLENWIGAPPLDYYFKLQECFAEKKIQKTAQECTELLKFLFNGNLLYATIVIFLKSNNYIPFPWFYMNPSAHSEYKIYQIKKVSNQFYEEGIIDETTPKGLFDYLERNSNKNSPLENIYLADFYYYELLAGVNNYNAAISLYEKAISSMMPKLNYKSFFIYNSLCILGRAYSAGEEIENTTKSQKYFKEAEKFIMFVQKGLK